MVVVLTSVPVSAQSPAPLLSQLIPAESIDAVIAFGFSRHDALRALNHVGGSANLAVNYLLDQPHSPPPTAAVEAKQKQSLERRRDSGQRVPRGIPPAPALSPGLRSQRPVVPLERRPRIRLERRPRVPRRVPAHDRGPASVRERARARTGKSTYREKHSNAA